MSLLLEIGGSHITGAAGPEAALVRLSLDGADPLAVLATVVTAVGPVPGTWGVAVPGPFDLTRGVGSYGGTGKLEGLDGVDLRALLVGLGADDAVFVNDADAFALGAWERNGRPRRLAALSLGSGVGSGFVADGDLVQHDPSVPPEGSAHLLEHQGRPLEETFSRKALRQAWTAYAGECLDVHEIVARPDALAVLGPAARGLGEALSPWLQAFSPDLLVVGGSIARSWSLLAPSFDTPFPVVVDTDERTAMRGALVIAGRRPAAPS